MKKKDTQKPSDQEIIAGMMKGGASGEKMLKQFYRQYSGYVINGENKYHLSKEEAMDAYADAILAVWRKIQAGHFRGDSKLSTYLYRAFQNKCVDRKRKAASNRDIEWADELPDLPDKASNILADITSRETVESLRGYMAKLGDRCRQILMDTEYNGYNMEEAAKRLGLKDRLSAATMKYRCLKKLRNLLKNVSDDIKNL